MNHQIQQPDFIQAYNNANEKEREKLDEIIKSLDLALLKEWIKEFLNTPFDLMSYRELREIAKNNNIHGYSLMSMDELVEKLNGTSVERRRKFAVRDETTSVSNTDSKASTGNAKG